LRFERRPEAPAALVEVVESSDAELSLPPAFKRFTCPPPAGFCDRESNDPRGERPSEEGRSFVEGKMSFFCLLAGNISSRSTGTPRETRKRRRMRERSQLGGAKGGGAISWVYRDSDRSERNICGEAVGCSESEGDE